MIKKHKKTIALAASVLLGASAWAGFSGSTVLETIRQQALAAPAQQGAGFAAPAAAGTDAAALFDRVASAEAPLLLAQARVPQTPQPVTAQATPSGFSAGMSAEELKAEIAVQVAQGKSLESVLQAARSAGVKDAEFASAASKAGVAVASITATLLNLATNPAAVADALKALGTAFAGDQVALEAVFATAATASNVALSPAAVESSIEAGCGRDCLPAAVVANAQTTSNAPAVSAPPPSTTTNSSVGGGGGGGSNPISPT